MSLKDLNFHQDIGLSLDPHLGRADLSLLIRSDRRGKPHTTTTLSMPELVELHDAVVARLKILGPGNVPSGREPEAEVSVGPPKIDFTKPMQSRQDPHPSYRYFAAPTDIPGMNFLTYSYFGQNPIAAAAAFVDDFGRAYTSRGRRALNSDIENVPEVPSWNNQVYGESTPIKAAVPGVPKTRELEWTFDRFERSDLRDQIEKDYVLDNPRFRNHPKLRGRG